MILYCQDLLNTVQFLSLRLLLCLSPDFTGGTLQILSLRCYAVYFSRVTLHVDGSVTVPPLFVFICAVVPFSYLISSLCYHNLFFTFCLTYLYLCFHYLCPPAYCIRLVFPHHSASCFTAFNNCLISNIKAFMVYKVWRNSRSN
jgi:hypothetical protein